MSKTRNNNKQKIQNLEDMIYRKIEKEGYQYSKIYTIDDESAIVIGGRYGYIQTMLHYKMNNGRLQEVIRLDEINVYGRLLKKHKIFMLMKNRYPNYDNICIALYDYQNCRFIVPEGKFDNIGYDESMPGIDKYHPNYLEKYNCFLAYFTLSSEASSGEEQIFYTSSINGRKYYHSFSPTQETYYALINKDGSIRANKIFKGADFTKIEEVVDLKEYGSLEAFKKHRIEVLTKIKEENKRAYYERLQRINNVTNSPYLDEEVVKVLTLEK